MKKPVRVFISYAHDSDEHKAKVLALANELRKNGIESWIDRYVENDSVDWPSWMHEQIEQADFVLCVGSPLFIKRFERKEEKGRGRGAKWEGAIIQLSLYEAEGDTGKFIPVTFSRDDEANIPKVLRGPTRYVLEDEKGFLNLLRRLTNQPRIVAPAVGTTPVLPAEVHTSAGTASASASMYAVPAVKSGEAAALLRLANSGNLRGFTTKFELLEMGEQAWVVERLATKPTDPTALRALGAIVEAAPAGLDVPALTTQIMRAILLRGDSAAMAILMASWPSAALRQANGQIREAFFKEIISIMRADQYEDVNRITPAVVHVEEAIPAALRAEYVEALLEQSESAAFQGQPAALGALRDLKDDFLEAGFALMTGEFLSQRRVDDEGCATLLKSHTKEWPADKRELFNDYLSMGNREFVEKYLFGED